MTADKLKPQWILEVQGPKGSRFRRAIDSSETAEAMKHIIRDYLDDGTVPTNSTADTMRTAPFPSHLRPPRRSSLRGRLLDMLQDQFMSARIATDTLLEQGYESKTYPLLPIVQKALNEENLFVRAYGNTFTARVARPARRGDWH